MRVVVCLLVGLVAACRTSGSAQVTAKHSPVELPVVVEEDRFFLQTRTATGGDLRVFLDSAGGMSLTRKAVERLRLPVKREEAAARRGVGNRAAVLVDSEALVKGIRDPASVFPPRGASPSGPPETLGRGP